MGEHPSRHVLIVGAGAIGIVYGYLLSLAGAEVTFLIRPHPADALSHPQLLYCYNNHELEAFKDYKYITDPSKVADTKYDYIIITLDGNALSSKVGRSLVKSIGKAVRGTKTQVILGGDMLDSKTWFLPLSGLSNDQVASGVFLIHAYSPKLVTLPLHEPTNKDLLAKADIAYSDNFGTSFILDDSSPELANGFAEFYNTSGASPCTVMPASQSNLSFIPFFAVFVASELLDWPKYRDINSKGEIWSLAVAAVKDIQQLNMCGELGTQTAEATNEAGFAAEVTAMEKDMLPLDLQSFNKYHHGGKVNVHNRQLLRALISQGEAEGKSMSSLKALLDRAEY